jgi:Leucine-rich repeat (LRR) protein
MSFNSIEEYFAQFPDDIESINVSIQTHYLPDLSRFYKLKDLVCSNNQLTQLPTLPPTLIVLYCISNLLTQLPTLPPTLTHLYCYENQLRQLPTLSLALEFLACNNNQLTQLPTLPPKLKYLLCSNNQLTQLPTLPSTLVFLDCRYNLLPFDNEKKITNTMEYIIQMRNKTNIIIRFKELFYAFKYKNLFRDWLWVRIREPKIRNKYHPDNLIKLLEGREKLTLDELDELDDNW